MDPFKGTLTEPFTVTPKVSQKGLAATGAARGALKAGAFGVQV